MKRSARASKNALLAIMLFLLSLPFVDSIVRAPTRKDDGVPNALGFGLMFVFFVTTTVLAWLLCFQAPRDLETGRELMLTRLGVSRMRLVLRELMRQFTLCFTTCYTLSLLGLMFYYGSPTATFYRELVVLLPVALSWAACVVLSLAAVRLWTHKLGLVVVALVYPMLLSRSIPLAELKERASTDWSPAMDLFFSPIFHAAHLLGAFEEPLPVAPWISSCGLLGFSCVALWAVALKVPR